MNSIKALRRKDALIMTIMTKKKHVTIFDLTGISYIGESDLDVIQLVTRNMIAFLLHAHFTLPFEISLFDFFAAFEDFIRLQTFMLS